MPSNLMTASFGEFSSITFWTVLYSGWNGDLLKTFKWLLSSHPGLNKRFNSKIVFPHADSPIINPLIDLHKRGLLNRFDNYSFHERSLTAIVFILI
jgi:hypothetical protein